MVVDPNPAIGLAPLNHPSELFELQAVIHHPRQEVVRPQTSRTRSRAHACRPAPAIEAPNGCFRDPCSARPGAVKIRLDEVKPKQIVGDAPGVVIIGSSIVLSVKKPAALKIMFFELIVILIGEFDFSCFTCVT